MLVELCAAKVPFAGFIASHYWFEISQEDRVDRWEVWQKPHQTAEQSWGHIHKNLLPPKSGVGAGASWLVHNWMNDLASDLTARIESSPDNYPWSHCYRYWPGPNSNTYVQWILGCDLTLGLNAIGKSYGRHG